MWKAFYEGSTLLDLPVLAMLIFMTVFGIVVVRALFRADRADDRLRQLPLEDETLIPRGEHHV